MRDFIRNEPVAFAGTVTTLFAAVIGVLVSFNIPLSDAQQAALTALVAALVGIPTVLFARPKSTPTANVVAYKHGDTVIAGEASHLPTGEVMHD